MQDSFNDLLARVKQKSHYQDRAQVVAQARQYNRSTSDYFTADQVPKVDRRDSVRNRTSSEAALLKHKLPAKQSRPSPLVTDQQGPYASPLPSAQRKQTVQSPLAAASSRPSSEAGSPVAKPHSAPRVSFDVGVHREAAATVASSTQYEPIDEQRRASSERPASPVELSSILPLVQGVPKQPRRRASYTMAQGIEPSDLKDEEAESEQAMDSLELEAPPLSERAHSPAFRRMSYAQAQLSAVDEGSEKTSLAPDDGSIKETKETFC